MKRLSLYLFLVLLTLQSPSWADDIRDFQIEGISLGDSLIDYYSKADIKDAKKIPAFSSNEFYRANFYVNLQVYDAILFYLKTGDDNYKIYSTSAILRYPNNIEECNKKKLSIAEEFKSLFENYETNVYSRSHDQDKTGESKFHSIDFDLLNGGMVRVMCINWSNNFEKNNFVDHLRVSMSLKEFRDFLKNKAYN